LSVDADPLLIAGWQPFFTVAASAAAALAGLLFVALSIHARDIAEHPQLRYRAVATLTIPLAVLVVSGLVLLPRQTGLSLGLEELVPLALQATALVLGFRQAHLRMRMARPYWLRTGFGLLLLFVTMLGCALLILGFEIGLSILALFCLISLVWMALNCWALLFAIADTERVEERLT
jgi:hypothetical protein